MRPRPVALITGASSGLGEALADRLAAAGYDRVLVDRRRERLSQVAGRLGTRGAAAEVLATDLPDRSEPNRVVERVNAGDLQVVISNAGVRGYAPVDEIDPSAVDRLWMLNSITPMLPTRAALPYLLASGSCGVITVASLQAFSGGHGSEFPRILYAGAKAATAALARTLAGELPGTGVTATVVCPGRSPRSGR